MPVWACFSYSADVPLSVTSHGGSTAGSARPRKHAGLSVLCPPKRHPAGCVQPAEDAVLLLQLPAHVLQLPGRHRSANRA
jgi:hypothetical protein